MALHGRVGRGCTLVSVQSKERRCKDEGDTAEGPAYSNLGFDVILWRVVR